MSTTCRVYTFLGHFPLKIGVIVTIIACGVIAVAYLGLAIHFFNSAAEVERVFEMVGLYDNPIYKDRKNIFGDMKHNPMDIIDLHKENIKWERAFASIFLIATFVFLATMGCLLYGNFKDVLKFVFISCILLLVALGLSVILLILLCVNGRAALVLPLVTVGTGCYLAVIVYSYYLGMKDGSARSPQPNGVQDEMIAKPPQEEPYKVVVASDKK